MVLIETVAAKGQKEGWMLMPTSTFQKFVLWSRIQDTFIFLVNFNKYLSSDVF